MPFLDDGFGQLSASAGIEYFPRFANEKVLPDQLPLPRQKLAKCLISLGSTLLPTLQTRPVDPLLLVIAFGKHIFANLAPAKATVDSQGLFLAVGIECFPTSLAA